MRSGDVVAAGTLRTSPGSRFVIVLHPARDSWAPVRVNVYGLGPSLAQPLRVHTEVSPKGALHISGVADESLGLAPGASSIAIVVAASDALADRVESSLVSAQPVQSGSGRGWQTLVLPVVYGSDGRSPK